MSTLENASGLLAVLSGLELLTPAQSQALLAEPPRWAETLLAQLQACGWITDYQRQRILANEATALVLLWIK